MSREREGGVTGMGMAERKNMTSLTSSSSEVVLLFELGHHDRAMLMLNGHPRLMGRLQSTYGHLIEHV